MPTVHQFSTREVEDAQAVIVKDARIGTWSISGAFEVLDADLSVTASSTDSGRFTARVLCAMPGVYANEGFDLEVERTCMTVVIGYSGPVIGRVFLG
jgi:hypothetical protein